MPVQLVRQLNRHRLHLEAREHDDAPLPQVVVVFDIGLRLRWASKRNGSFIAARLHIPATALADYAGMTDHARKLTAAVELREATRTEIPS